MTDIELVFDGLATKRQRIATLFDYYDGDQPLRYATLRLQRAFHALDVRFVENWCAVVVDALLDRIVLAALAVADDDRMTQVLTGAYRASGLIHDAHDLHTAISVAGEGYVIAWPNDQGQVEAYYNDPRLCTVIYDQDSPRVKRLAGKWWDSATGSRLTLYYPDRIEYYESARKLADVSSAAAFRLEREAANPYGVIPVFHFRRSRRTLAGDLDSVLTLQDAINKLLADQMIAAEFGAFRQRYIISQMQPTGTLKNAPNEIWELPAGDGTGQGTQVGEFSQTDLAGYQSAMDKLAHAMAVISRTPRHYFMVQGGDPSGEALVAMEAPLNKRATQFIAAIYPIWQEVGAFLLQLAGYQIEADNIVPQFERVETETPQSAAVTRKAAIEAGIPLVTALRDEGWTKAEIDQMMQDKAAEMAAQQTSLAAALIAQQRKFDQEGGAE